MLAIRQQQEELIVLIHWAERLVNRWESEGTHGYPWTPPHSRTHTHSIHHMIFFFLHLEEWHAHINGWIKERGHHLVDLDANGAAQLRFDFQWTDRDGVLVSLRAVYVQLQTLSGLSGLVQGRNSTTQGFCNRFQNVPLVASSSGTTSCSPDAPQETWQKKEVCGCVELVDTCSILERGAQVKLAAQMANVYNGIESCPA